MTMELTDLTDEQLIAAMAAEGYAVDVQPSLMGDAFDGVATHRSGEDEQWVIACATPRDALIELAACVL